MSGPFVSVYRCPAHPKLWTLCVDTPDGGTRVFGGKCCVRQYEALAVSWPLTQGRRDDLVEEMDAALESRP